MNLRRPVNVYTDCQGVADGGDVDAPAEWIQKIDYELFQKFPSCPSHGSKAIPG